MSTPVIGAVNLGIQALDGTNNSVIFNRGITGLQNPACADASFTAYLAISASIPTVLFNAPRSGLYIRNKAIVGAPDIVTVTWTPIGSPAAVVMSLTAQAMILVYFPDGTQNVGAPSLLSSIDGTLVEFAWWL